MVVTLFDEIFHLETPIEMFSHEKQYSFEVNNDATFFFS